MSEVKSQIFGGKFYYIVIILVTVFIFSCSVPNLEKPVCRESRETVKKFYSKHFGDNFKTNFENLNKGDEFLSSNLIDIITKRNENETDYFTQTSDYPKAFRVGSCEVISENKTIFEVLLFWKTEERSEQREVKVETIKENDKWLIDRVENK